GPRDPLAAVLSRTDGHVDRRRVRRPRPAGGLTRPDLAPGFDRDRLVVGELRARSAARLGSDRPPRFRCRRPRHDRCRSVPGPSAGDGVRAGAGRWPGTVGRPGPRRSRRVLWPVIDILRALSLSALGTVAFAAILLLPGARLADRLVGSRGGVSARLAASVVLSQLLIAGVGLALIAIGRFSGVAVAVAAIAFSVISLPTAVGWLRAGIRDGRKRRLAVAPIWFVLLVTPWIGAVGLPGWPPADTLQWYYDG